jgi:predicted PurR-regulated permease PerM
VRRRGSASKDEVPVSYGEPGRRLRASPFLFGVLATTGAAIAAIAFLGLYRIGTVIAMIVAAGFFALGLDRPVSAMQRRLHLGRGVAVTIVALTGLLFVCGVLALGIPPLARQAGAFFAELPERVSAALANGKLTGLASSTDLRHDVSQVVTPSNVAKVAAGVIGGVGTLVGVIFIGVTTAMLTLFVLAGLPRIRQGAYRLVVASRRDRVGVLADAVQDKVGGYIVGAVAVAACAGAAAFVWSWLAGVPYPMVMALVVALFDLIPQIGATIGSTIVILVALSQSLSLAVATLVFFCAYQGLENWVIYPRVMSRAVKISNLAAIVAAMSGFAIFGVLGVLLAVPAYASVQLIVREVVLPRQDAR